MLVIILINLLIAMMSHTYDNVQEESLEEWLVEKAVILQVRYAAKHKEAQQRCCCFVRPSPLIHANCSADILCRTTRSRSHLSPKFLHLAFSAFSTVWCLLSAGFCTGCASQCLGSQKKSEETISVPKRSRLFTLSGDESCVCLHRGWSRRK